MRSFFIILTAAIFSSNLYSQNISDSRDISNVDVESTDYSRLGIQARGAFFGIATNDFDVQSSTGLLAGFTSRSRIFENFKLIYGVDFLIASIGVESRALGQTTLEQAEFSVTGAQVNGILSYDILDQFLTVNFGPSLLINGPLRVRNDGQRDNIINGFNSLTAQDLLQISRITPFLVGGVEGGWKKVRLTLQYQFGFTNILGRLNREDLQDIDASVGEFNGNATLFSAGVVVYL